MITYKCDGETFYHAKKCKSEKNVIDKEEMPFGWIVLHANVYHNELRNRRVISCNHELHFCSKECFMSYFFKMGHGNRVSTKKVYPIYEHSKL